MSTPTPTLPDPPPAPVTTRELAEWIDMLIYNRIYQFAVKGLGMPDDQSRKLADEDFDVLKHMVANGLTSLLSRTP
jgi:hypothetical protein